MISAKTITDSISDAGIRITTLELEYPRFIHSQFMTHRMFSRNAQSSRAIPTSKQIELIRDAELPIFQQNKAGMQAGEILDYEELVLANDTWDFAKVDAIEYAETLVRLGVHKQWANRLLEPFSTIKVVVTATEWDSFFKLRLHHDAQPEIQELAQAMKTAMDESRPKLLNQGQWHLPYMMNDIHTDMKLARMISAARCARVSYLNHDNTKPDAEKDLELARQLLADGHLSPFEHQAKPMAHYRHVWSDKGQTHITKDGYLFSNNFRGWIQHRAIV